MRMQSIRPAPAESMIRLPKVTQEEFIEILTGDLQLTRTQRNFYMSDVARRQVTAIDQLSPAERSAVIDELRRIKDQRTNYRSDT